MRVCFVRADRIGDLVLTLPAAEVWLEARPNDQIFWCIQEALEVVVRRQVNPSLAASPVITVGDERGISAAALLAARLKPLKLDAALIFHAPWWVALGLRWAGISNVWGVRSSWQSYVLYTDGLRQKRSQALKNEADYNLELTVWALQQMGTAIPDPSDIFKTNRHADLRADTAKAHFWAGRLPKEYVVVHPGMGGSARNWSPTSYQQLYERLRAAHVGVVVTCGPMDEAWVRDTRADQTAGVQVIKLTSLDDLLAVLSQARCVAAPSTGVVHLAASVGVPTIGIYSPVRVQAPKRWGPRGPAVRVAVPDVPCPGEHQCLGRECPYWDCMEQITVDRIFEAMRV